MSDDLEDLLEIKSANEEIKAEKTEDNLKKSEQQQEALLKDVILEKIPQAEILQEEISQPSLQSDSVQPEPQQFFLEASSEDAEITYSPSRVSNYSTLKTIAKTLKFFAWVTVLGGIGAAGWSINFFDGRGGHPDSEFYLLLISGVCAIFFAIQLSLTAERINVTLDIEANTRQSAKTLERILKSL